MRNKKYWGPPGEQMTDDEIHDFGIEIVANQLMKEGHELVDVNSDPDQNPQIVARINGQLAFIAVRTAVYPRDGEIKDQLLHDQLIEHARKHDAIPYFASVGIGNKNGFEHGNEDEIGTPIRGVPFYVNYRGLKIIAHANQIKIASDGKVRDFVPGDAHSGKLGQKATPNNNLISPNALREAFNNMHKDLGDIDDLPMELANTLANVYYRFFAQIEHLNSGGKSRLLEPFIAPANDALTAYKNYNQFFAETVSALEYAKNFVQAARLTRSQNPKLFPYIVTLILDTLKYNIKNANSKTRFVDLSSGNLIKKSTKFPTFMNRLSKQNPNSKDNAWDTYLLIDAAERRNADA